MIWKVILGWLAFINVVAFILYGVDKLLAKKHMWRISENTLVGFAVFGGSIGAIAGMKVFHHKTLHNKFRIGLPVILFVQLAVCVFVLLKLKNVI